MRIVYYPGCTLYEKAKTLDQSARLACSMIDIELFELPNWTCCGTTFPLVTDNVMNLVAAARILANAKKEGDRLTTLCAFCFNVLKRTNKVIKEDKDKREKLNLFLEEDYQGDLEVIHLLEILRDDIGFENLDVKNKIALKVAPYYGCKLLRPFEEIQMDDPENPTILEDFLSALGCEVVRFPHKNECCGSYLVVSQEKTAIDCSFSILDAATKCNAEAIAVSCPLCFYNLDRNQEEIKKQSFGFEDIPVFYFTELLGIALGADIKLEGHFVDPYPLLKMKNLPVQEVRK